MIKPIQGMTSTDLFTPFTDFILKKSDQKKEINKELALFATYFSKPIDYVIQIPASIIFISLESADKIRISLKEKKFSKVLSEVIFYLPKLILKVALVAIYSFFKTADSLASICRCFNRMSNSQNTIDRHFFKKEMLYKKFSLEHRVLYTPHQTENGKNMSDTDKEIFIKHSRLLYRTTSTATYST